MKSTTFGVINNHLIVRTVVSRPDRWKALPFMILMLSTGLPLNYNLEPARPLYVTDVAELTMGALSNANGGSSILFALFLGGLYAMAGWSFLRRPKEAALILCRQWPLLLLMLYIAASALWSFYPEKVVFNIVHNLGIVLIALAATLRYRHDPWLFPKHLGYILGVNLIFHLAAVLLIPTYSIDWQGRWHGLAMHPNTFGSFVLSAWWANAAVLICTRSDRHHLHLLFCVLAAIGMIGADSVTSILTAVATIATIYLIRALQRKGAGRNFYIGLLSSIVLLAALVAVTGSTLDLSWLFNMFGRDSNLTGRTSIWADAYSAISMRPLLGWSFDDHFHLIRTQGMPYSSYHNGALDLAVNGGAIAIILFLMLLGSWIAGFANGSRIGQQIAPLSVSFVIAYLSHNISEASLVAPRDQAWVIFLVLIFLSVCRYYPRQAGAQGGAGHLPPLQIGPAARFGQV